MAAGQGFKTFTTGEVLTAGDVNGYLMQGINVFADATARDAAITAPAEGQFAFTKDNNSLWYYDGAAWVASGATGDIEGVTASSPLTGGGTSGTVTVGIQDASTSQRGSVQLSDSTSTTDSTLAATSTAVKSAYDLADGAIPKTLTTTTGDTIYASGANTPARLGIGSTGQVLTVAGGVPTWATPSGGTADYSLLSSATPSGSTYTVTGLSGYNNIFIEIETMSSNTSSAICFLRMNTDTGSNYGRYWVDWTASSTYSANNTSSSANATATRIDLGLTSNNTSSTLSGYAQIMGANTSGKKMVNYVVGGTPAGGTGHVTRIGSGVYNSTSVISSISLVNSAGAWNGGTVRIYGSVA